MIASEINRMLLGRSHEVAWVKHLIWCVVCADLDRSQATFKPTAEPQRLTRRSA